MESSEALIKIIRSIYGAQGNINLHEPSFTGNEKSFVVDTIDSTFVSSIGEYVQRFEKMLCDITGAKSAIAISNGTSALFIALKLAGVRSDDLVITQSLTFVATANAIAQLGASPIFLDIDRSTLGLSAENVKLFLESECELVDGICRHRGTKKRVSACLPMHSFGFPCDIENLIDVCNDWLIPVVEDAAEALGSVYKGKSCGTFGTLGVVSFNGNKICTTGGGGAILTNDVELGKLARHITTTAKIPHKWKFEHDMVAYNFRMPNLNAALGCAQLEQLDLFLSCKRKIANKYKKAFDNVGIEYLCEPKDSISNYWLNSILATSKNERDIWLNNTNSSGVMTRPVWEPMHTLTMYKDAIKDDLKTTVDIADRLLNIPSSAITTKLIY